MHSTTNGFLMNTTPTLAELSTQLSIPEVMELLAMVHAKSIVYIATTNAAYLAEQQVNATNERRLLGHLDIMGSSKALADECAKAIAQMVAERLPDVIANVAQAYVVPELASAHHDEFFQVIHYGRS